MNPGKSQNDIVSGGAKLSWILVVVRLVGTSKRVNDCGCWLGDHSVPFITVQTPEPSTASRASTRRSSSVSCDRNRNMTSCSVRFGDTKRSAWMIDGLP